MRINLAQQGLLLKDASLPGVEGYSEDSVLQSPWEWDRVVKASHLNSCAWQQHCAFNVYVKDGVVLREEQVGTYPPRNDPSIPDLNPRGCQKGVCHSHRMYDATRLKYPLKRAGARGDGKWQRISWDQALTEIADTLIDVLAAEGPLAVVGGAANMRNQGTAQAVGRTQFFDALGVLQFGGGGDVGDHWPGIAQTCGKMFMADSADNWFHADILLMWGGNPAFTHMPNYHFFTEARYHGVKIIVISPEYQASAVHADVWVPVNVGSDAALGLGMAQVIIKEHLYKDDFVREQTDLPLLVRKDTGHYLRESDLKRGGRDDLFYMRDEKSGKIVEAPRKSLALSGVVPALSGEYEVSTLQGKVKVTPVMELLKQKLDAEYTPEQAYRICGVSPQLIASLAREIAQAKGVVNSTTSVWGKFYHGDLVERAQILIFALCGHMGRKGASYNAFPAMRLDTAVGNLLRKGDALILAAASGDPRYSGWREAGYTDEMILYQYIQETFAAGGVVPSVPYIRMQAGLQEVSEKYNSWDPYLKRPLKEYVDMAYAKGWQFNLPSLRQEPRIWFVMGGDVFRRMRGTTQIMENLLRKVKLLVTMDWRMCYTGMYSDYVLPVATNYEQTATFFTGRPVTPFLHVNDQATPPFGESLSEWQLFLLFARKVEERARAKGVQSYKDSTGRERRFDQLLTQLTVNGMYEDNAEEDIARDIYYNSANIEIIDWEDFKAKGFTPYTSIGKSVGQMVPFGNSCDFVVGEPMIPCTWHTQKKQPWPTLTRRMQFYIEQELFMELGEALPTHKDSPKMGGDYPLQMTGGHTRWSLHSDLIDDVVLLRLLRGEPLVLLSEQDAEQRGIRDGDQAEVFNDIGSFQAQALVSPGVRPGQAIVHHGWVNYQFPGHRHFKSVQPGPLNPNTLAGKYFHIHGGANFMPAFPDRATRVEAKKAL